MNARWARPACDPELPERLRSLTSHTPAGSRPRRWLSAASPMARRAVLAATGLATACLVAALINPLSAPWAGAWLACGGAAAITAAVLYARLSPERELGRSAGRVIHPHDLSPQARLLLARAQRAIDDILGSQVRSAGLLEADEPALRRHEWEIACALRDVTAVAALHPDEVAAGTMTAAVLDAQQRAITLAQDSTAARVGALERYADQVRAADAAHHDWASALKLAGLNDRYLDLVARTAADELAVSEISELTDRAAVTRQVLTDSLREASTAAEVLALPA
jgi:hypothetical protein